MKRWGVFVGSLLCASVLMLTGTLLGGQPDAEKPGYVSSMACAGCHEDLSKEWEKLPHGRFLMAEGREAPGKGCEECHGPGMKHAAGDVKAIINPAKGKPEREAALCLQCHRRNLKPAEWHAGAHAKARIGCSKCHDVHHPTKNVRMLRKTATTLCLSCHPEQRAQFRRNAHHPVLEERMSCLDCHDPHRTNVRSALAKDGSDLCANCHAEKAGPFLYAHDTAGGDGADGCMACHQPHGSSQPQLLRAAGRGLCLQCHVDKLTHNPGGTCWRAGCHVDVHGSNRDPRFVR